MNYQEQLEKYLESIKDIEFDMSYGHVKETFFESMKDWSQFHSLDEIKSWFYDKRKNSTLKVEDINLKDVSDWNVDQKTGNITHISNDFFIIHGVRVTSKNREVEVSWDQPILEQVGYDGGLLGIIRKRFNNVPHYLCEAKEEPGNYGKVQISPSLQATFANLNQSHGGRKPYFSDLFLNCKDNENIKILFDSWLAEDGGRLHLKRNRGILLEVPEVYEVNLPSEQFIWLSLFQIKELLKEDAWINPHVRGILAHA